MVKGTLPLRPGSPFSPGSPTVGGGGGIGGGDGGAALQKVQQHVQQLDASVVQLGLALAAHAADTQVRTAGFYWD